MTTLIRRPAQEHGRAALLHDGAGVSLEMLAARLGCGVESAAERVALGRLELAGVPKVLPMVCEPHLAGFVRPTGRSEFHHLSCGHCALLAESMHAGAITARSRWHAENPPPPPPPAPAPHLPTCPVPPVPPRIQVLAQAVPAPPHPPAPTPTPMVMTSAPRPAPTPALHGRLVIDHPPMLVDTRAPHPVRRGLPGGLRVWASRRRVATEPT